MQLVQPLAPFQFHLVRLKQENRANYSLWANYFNSPGTIEAALAQRERPALRPFQFYLLTSSGLGLPGARYSK